jgi:hypothetical protein
MEVAEAEIGAIAAASRILTYVFVRGITEHPEEDQFP